MKCQVKKFVEPTEEELNEFLKDKDIFNILSNTVSGEFEWLVIIWVVYKQ